MSPPRALWAAVGVLYNARVKLGCGGCRKDGGKSRISRGALEIGETLIEGVRRELLEETGIEVNVGEVIEVFERIDMDAGGKAKHHYVVLDYLCEYKHGEARAGSDVTDVVWATQEELAKYSLSETATRVILKAFEIVRTGTS
jgi:8-oxo-dGTP diphosphatase